MPKEWIAKYRGRFDEGWDKLREATLARQKQMGVVPADTILAPKPAAIKDWDRLTTDEERLFSHEMELFAGFGEYADAEIGRLIDAVKETGQFENTLIFYIVGDNGASAEGGMNGLYNEMSYFNGVQETVEDILQHFDEQIRTGARQCLFNQHDHLMVQEPLHSVCLWGCVAHCGMLGTHSRGGSPIRSNLRILNSPAGMSAYFSVSASDGECTWRSLNVDVILHPINWGGSPSKGAHQTRVCPCAINPTNRNCSCTTALSRSSENSWSLMITGGSQWSTA